MTPDPTTPPPPPPTPPGPPPPTDQEVIETLIRAKKGDPTTLPALRAWLKYPGMIDVMGGNLARTAERATLTYLAPNDLPLQEAATEKMTAMRAELAGRDPSPLETLLVERVVVCWAQAYLADVLGAKAGSDDEARFSQAQRRMTGAHRRFLSAVKMLATVRRLAMPVLVTQINVAGRQVVKGPA